MKLSARNIIYSEDVATLTASDYGNRWCCHMLCKSGSISLKFNGRDLTMAEKDLFVSTRIDLLAEIKPGADGCEVEMIIAPLTFLNAQLPVNNFGIGGSIQLFKNPVITVSRESAAILSADFQAIRHRLSKAGHLFYHEVMAHLCGVMMNDIFDAHSRSSSAEASSLYSTSLVSRFMDMLSADNVRQNRSVAYYASLLHVTPKYLSNTIRRLTGQSVTALINRQAIPILKDYLCNTDLPLERIADKMNFCSVSHMCVFTQRHLGDSPARLRHTLQPKS